MKRPKGGNVVCNKNSSSTTAMLGAPLLVLQPSRFDMVVALSRLSNKGPTRLEKAAVTFLLPYGGRPASNNRRGQFSPHLMYALEAKPAVGKKGLF
jgi:hypothetical protein